MNKRSANLLAAAIHLAAEVDESFTDEERDSLLSAVSVIRATPLSQTYGPDSAKRVVSRKEFAALVHRTPSWVSRLVKENPNILEVIVPQGRKNPIGYSFDSVRQFLAGRRDLQLSLRGLDMAAKGMKLGAKK